MTLSRTYPRWNHSHGSWEILLKPAPPTPASLGTTRSKTTSSEQTTALKVNSWLQLDYSDLARRSRAARRQQSPSHCEKKSLHAVPYPVRSQAMEVRELCTCGHQRAAHHKAESPKPGPGAPGKMPKAKTDCALCYCTQFKGPRKTASDRSRTAILPTSGKTLYRRSDLGRKLSAPIPVTQSPGKRMV